MENDGPITSVPQLLALHDRRFILSAYQALLGRAPDTAGETHYLSRLRAGTHKLTILKHLRQSGEGRAFVPGVAGLDRAIKRHAWANLPVIGFLFRAVTGAEGDGATDRHLRILLNETDRLSAEQAAIAWRVEQLSAQISELSVRPVCEQPGNIAPAPSPDNPELAADLPSGTSRRSGLAGFFQTSVWKS